MASVPSEQKPITRLPDFFPTYPVVCKEPAKAFFACFEEHAVMKHDLDTDTPRQSILHCQETLKGYISCVENHEKPKQSGWLW